MTTAADFDKRYNIVDKPVPRHTLMAGRYKQSFAYYTLRERLPVILTRIIDNLAKDKDELAANYGEESREELKIVVGMLSKLKYQLQTDKPLELFEGDEPDKEVWNTFIQSLPKDQKSFFSTCWLYAECYVYRKVSSYFEGMELMKPFDYFFKQKVHAAEVSNDVMEAVVECTRNLQKDVNSFTLLLKMNLWGNRCDLSISEGKEVKPTSGVPCDTVKSFEPNLLVDDSRAIWSCIAQSMQDPLHLLTIDIVCDNMGYELFTDLILAEFIIEHKLANKVRFHVKAIPWFISDVTRNDFLWTLEYLCGHSRQLLKDIGKRWMQLFNGGKFELMPTEYFWTSPFEYYRMREVEPALYEKLAESHLIIFKGDLNYRKLIGDFTWEYTEPFNTCLRNFQPTNLCSLRTIKADLICGLAPGQAESLFNEDKDWMITGEYGVIQFSELKRRESQQISTVTLV